jgi:hypothetical protein
MSVWECINVKVTDEETGNGDNGGWDGIDPVSHCPNDIKVSECGAIQGNRECTMDMFVGQCAQIRDDVSCDSEDESCVPPVETTNPDGEETP